MDGTELLEYNITGNPKAASKMFWDNAKAGVIDNLAFMDAYEQDLRDLGLTSLFSDIPNELFKYYQELSAELSKYNRGKRLTSKNTYGAIKRAADADPNNWALIALKKFWALQFGQSGKVVYTSVRDWEDTQEVRDYESLNKNRAQLESEIKAEKEKRTKLFNDFKADAEAFAKKALPDIEQLGFDIAGELTTWLDSIGWFDDMNDIADDMEKLLIKSKGLTSADLPTGRLIPKVILKEVEVFNVLVSAPGLLEDNSVYIPGHWAGPTYRRVYIDSREVKATRMKNELDNIKVKVDFSYKLTFGNLVDKQVTTIPVDADMNSWTYTIETIKHGVSKSKEVLKWASEYASFKDISVSLLDSSSLDNIKFDFSSIKETLVKSLKGVFLKYPDKFELLYDKEKKSVDNDIKGRTARAKASATKIVNSRKIQAAADNNTLTNEQVDALKDWIVQTISDTLKSASDAAASWAGSSDGSDGAAYEGAINAGKQAIKDKFYACNWRLDYNGSSSTANAYDDSSQEETVNSLFKNDVKTVDDFKLTIIPN